MLVLGIDTATWVASVGLVHNGASLGEESRWVSSSHTEVLLPLLTDVLTRAGVALTAVQGLGVSIGPGSFTGLRIALSTAKGFAYALGQQLVGVSTLTALAATVTDWAGFICPVLNARRREVYAAVFSYDQQGTLHRLTPDMVLPPQALFEQVAMPCLFLGDGVEAYGSLIQERYGTAALLLPFATHHPRGTVVAKLAWERLCRGEQDDLQTLEPCYVRPSDAERKRVM